MEVGSKVFVNNGARGDKENFNPAGTVTVNNTMSPDTKAVKSLQLFREGLGIAGGKRDQGELDTSAGLGGESAEIITNPPGDDDLNLQWPRAGKT